MSEIVNKIHLSKSQHFVTEKYKNIKKEYAQDVLQLMGQLILEYYIISNRLYKTNVSISQKEEEINEFIDNLFDIDIYEQNTNENYMFVNYNINKRFSNNELITIYKHLIKKINRYIKIEKNKLKLILDNTKKFIQIYKYKILKSPKCDKLDKLDLVSFYDARNYSIYQLYTSYTSNFEDIRLYYLRKNKENNHYMAHIFVLKEYEIYYGKEYDNQGYKLQFIGIQQSLLLLMETNCNETSFGISKKLFNVIKETCGFKEANTAYAYAYKTISYVLVKYYGFKAIVKCIKKYNKETKKKEFIEVPKNTKKSFWCIKKYNNEKKEMEYKKDNKYYYRMTQDINSPYIFTFKELVDEHD